MALTKSFRETVKARAARDPEYRLALFKAAVEAMLSGDLDAGKSQLRAYVNATLGFEALGRETGKSSKSLMRMLGPSGNPRADNLLAILSHLGRREGVAILVARDEDLAA